MLGVGEGGGGAPVRSNLPRQSIADDDEAFFLSERHTENDHIGGES
jgi:hypothetical protein